MRRAVLLALALWLVGCVVATDPEPRARQPSTTALSDSRPDTVKELTDRLAADLASDPSGWPSRSDYELVVLPLYDDRPDSIDEALADFEHYAAVYVAAECLAGRETTPAGFRELVGRTFSAGRDRIPRIAAEAETAIAGILAHAPQVASPPCLRPYVTPSLGRRSHNGPAPGPSCPSREPPRPAPLADRRQGPRDSPRLVRPPRVPL